MTVNVRAPIVPGEVSPWRPVPPEIPRPQYVGRKPSPYRGSHVQTPETIEKMRVAGRLAAHALQLAGEYCKPGVTTDEIDRVVHEFFCDHGAYPSTLGYPGPSGTAPPFPKSCCTSLNEVVCHGIPDSTVLEDGDIINVDVTGYLDGVHGDTDATFLVGEVSEPARLLVTRTREAMLRGIKAIAPGRQLNVIGRVIESYARRFGYGVVREFTGHGIGSAFHSGLYVPHYDSPELEVVLEPGMTFTVEPMITLGEPEPELWADGWTAVTRDRSWTAQFEHTVAVTEDGYEILTLP